MTTSAVPITHKFPDDSKQIKWAKVGFTVAAAVAAAIGIRRVFLKRGKGFHQYKHHFEEWLTPRLRTLSETLGVSSEVESQMSKEVHAAAKATLCMGRASQKVRANKRDLIEIGLERRLLKMKKRIHQMIDIKEAAQATALHEFYEELRQWLIPKGNEHKGAAYYADT